MSDPIDIELQIIFEEYKTLKAEIQRRSRDQLTCIQSSLVTIATLAGIVRFDVQQFKILLLIAPWILLTLGNLWFDHHITIHDLGFYLKKLEKHIKYLDSNSISTFIKKRWGWETFYSDVRQQRKRGRFLYLPLGRFIFLQNYLSFFYFLIPSILSIVSYFFILRQSFSDWSLMWESWSFLWVKSKSFPYWTELMILILDFILTIYFFVFWWQANVATDQLLSSRFQKHSENENNNDSCILIFKDEE